MKCCEEYALALSAFADGELNEEERAALLAHLEECENCREYLSELMVMHAMFEELPELDAPQGFAESVLARVHEEERGKKRRHRALFRTLAACFALVLITAAAARFVLPGAGKMSDDSSAESCDQNAASPDGAVSSGGYSESFDIARSDSIHYDLRSGEETADTDGETLGDGAENPEMSKVSYRNVRVDTSAAAEFLSARGMAVYDETEESVSFLVTPEVAHELAAEPELGIEAAALLADTGELVIVEVTLLPADDSDPSLPVGSEAEDPSASSADTAADNSTDDLSGEGEDE